MLLILLIQCSLTYYLILFVGCDNPTSVESCDYCHLEIETNLQMDENGIYHLDYDIGRSIIFAIGISAFVSSLIGFLALRTTGVSFMIVTLMFSQIAYLSILYLNQTHYRLQNNPQSFLLETHLEL